MTRAHASMIATFAVVACAVGILSLSRASPGGAGPAHDLEAQIGVATGLEIAPGSLAWVEGSPPEGLDAAVFSTEVLFLARARGESQRDLYVADVRVAPGPDLVSVAGFSNLTLSGEGDDFLLVVRPPRAVVATRALGQVRSLTVFGLDGQDLPVEDGWTPVQRLLAQITNLLETGRRDGVSRMHVRFMEPPREVDLQLLETRDGGAEVVVEWVDRLGEREIASVDATSGVSGSDDLASTVQMRLPKRPLLWAVDTARSVSWIGAGPIEWMEGRFFALRDWVRRLTYRIADEGAGDVGEDEDAGAEGPAIELPRGLEVGAEDLEAEWPPPSVSPPVFQRRRAGEGIWKPAGPEFTRGLPGAPIPIYRTYVRSDRERPYVRVELFAMDMRQLDLHMVAGHEDPRPTTGAGGTGRLPRDPDLLPRVVAAFNGAFKTEHGAYGMMVERNVLLPPQDLAATVASVEGGLVAMGSWPEGMPIPEDMISMRQNMDPLVEDGVVNPRRRYLWGFTLGDDITEMNTIRSGVCLARGGHLVYAWGEDLTARTLGVAMNAAGCEYGIHLDMNPFHTSFIFYSFGEVEPDRVPEFEAEVALSEMRFSARRYIHGAPKDFFFVALKDVSAGPGWESEGIAQPAPAFVPAVFRKTEVSCDLAFADMDRVRVALASGEVPRDLAPLAGGSMESGDFDRILVELPLGPWSEERGQMVRGAVAAHLEPDGATVAVRHDGSFALGPWPLDEGSESPVDDAVQGRWLLRRGSPVPGSGTASAVGRLGDGRLLVGHGPWGDLARAMADAGAETAVAFPSPEEGSWAAIRGERGVAGFDGEPYEVEDPAPAAIRLLAVPRDLGGTRLERLYAR